jgi:glucosamine--fructose-6-phosphate aminotransferase (isomerizing)
MPSLYAEISQQPEALAGLVQFYASPEGEHRLSLLPGRAQVLLTGMGASYHAAWIAAQHFNSLGLAAAAVESVDLVYYTHVAVRPRQPLVYVSQSGRSGEVAPALAALAGRAALIAVTNDESSELAQAAQAVLPLMAGREDLVATKTYINTLATLWLAARHWAGVRRERDLDALRGVADRIAGILAAREQVTGRLLAEFAGARELVFLGHGPHAATARQAAMIMSEWSKVAALDHGIGAYRHGFIETAGGQTGAVIFVAPGPARQSAEQVAAELAGFGAKVLLVEAGALRQPGEPATAEPLPDEFLSPLLDVIPVQLFTDALAEQRLDEPGFRHIGKVVTTV